MILSAPDTALHRAAAHLDAALSLALRHAQDDDDELLGPWADTAYRINLASSGLLPGPYAPIEPVKHPDCLTALQAAAEQIAQVRPGIDAPLADLALTLQHLAAALQHAQTDRDAPPSPPSRR